MDDDVALVATNESHRARSKRGAIDIVVAATTTVSTEADYSMLELTSRSAPGTRPRRNGRRPRSYLTVTFGRRLRPMAPANSSSRATRPSAVPGV